jgi:hypothetical protein
MKHKSVPVAAVAAAAVAVAPAAASAAAAAAGTKPVSPKQYLNGASDGAVFLCSCQGLRPTSESDGEAPSSDSFKKLILAQ